MDSLISFFIGILSSLAATFFIKYVLERYSSRLNFKSVLKDILILHKMIDKDAFSPDYIVAIDRNGCIVGAILAGYMGTRTVISIATENVRKPDGKRESKLSEAHLPRQGVFFEKKILIIIAFNETGTSLEMVYNYYATLSEKPAEIRTAALYTTVSPKIKPKYFVKEVGQDIKVTINQIMYKMPWMKKEWKHSFGDERMPHKKL